MILSKIKRIIIEQGLICRGESVLIGLSGGADSICLTHVLNSLKDELGITLYTAHLNHGIRGAEADRDENFVKIFSEKNGIRCFTLTANVPDFARSHGISEEAAGRQIRYDFFINLCREHGIDKIATAHNKNDNAETIMMNFMRGSSLKGIGGIQYKRDNIIRPLLDISRAEIEQYCEANKLEYVNDSTNETLEYTRNKIRHMFIPLIEREFNSNFVNTVTNNSVLISEDSAYIDDVAAEIYAAKVLHNSISVDNLNALDISVRRRVIRLMIKKAKNNLADVSLVSVSDVLELLKKNSGTSVNLPEDIVARIEYGRLIIEKKQVDSVPFCQSISRNSSVVIPELNAKVSVTDCSERKKDGAIYISCGTDSITVRSRREGDFFYPYGMSGSQKVKEYFINNKIPRGKRNSVPIIEIEGQLAAVGSRVDKRFVFNGNGVRIEFKPMEV